MVFNWRNEKPIYARTSLMYSKPMSDIVGRDVFIKLENTQPSGSFKLRGLSVLCQQRVKEGATSFMGTSGGNAGLALAYVAEKMKIPCDIYVPEYVPIRMIRKLEAYGAKVTMIGRDWQEANEAAMKVVKGNPKIAFIHPYDHPVIWEGHSTMITEIEEDLRRQGKGKPACIVASVGGGGFALGLLQGMDKVSWRDVPLLCMETEGAECFHLSLQQNKIVELDRLRSIAKTLGARAVTPPFFKVATSGRFKILTKVLPDKDAVLGCVRLADDHGFLVEPSCGVTMASVYSNVFPGILKGEELKRINAKDNKGPIVLIACGGSDISHEILEDFGKMFNISLKDDKNDYSGEIVSPSVIEYFKKSAKI